MGNPNKQHDRQGITGPDGGDQSQFSGGQQGQPSRRSPQQGTSGSNPKEQGTGHGAAPRRQPEDSTTGDQPGTFQGGETTGSSATGSAKGEDKDWSPASDQSGT